MHCSLTVNTTLFTGFYFVWSRVLLIKYCFLVYFALQISFTFSNRRFLVYRVSVVMFCTVRSKDAHYFCPCYLFQHLAVFLPLQSPLISSDHVLCLSSPPAVSAGLLPYFFFYSLIKDHQCPNMFFSSKSLFTMQGPVWLPHSCLFLVYAYFTFSSFQKCKMSCKGDLIARKINGKQKNLNGKA